MVNIVDDRKAGAEARGFKYLVLLICGGILINVSGSIIMGHFEIPLYMDSIGTIIAAMLGGYLPGIFVGFFSSLTNSILNDPESISYSMINVIFAQLTIIFHEKGWFKNPVKILCAIIIYGLFGGVFGAILTGIIYGFGSETASLNFLKLIYEAGKLTAFQAALIADIIVDTIDKSISVAIALLVVMLIPENVRERFSFKNWKQAPLTSDAVKAMHNRKSRTFSLRTKVILLLIFATSLVAFSAIFISTLLYRDAIVQTESETVHIIKEIGDSSGIDLSGISPYSEKETASIVFRYAIKQISLFCGLFILILAIGLHMSDYHLIIPINSMALTASMFSDEGEDNLDMTVKTFKELKISTGDEIENLYDAFLSRIVENLAFTEDIKNKNETITALQNSLIIVLADMVESRDQNTGDHVKNTAEYTRIIMDEMVKEGIYKDLLTPELISDIYHSAPLHDVGKISISDTILNKPGKLTDEEFEKMKSHSEEGAMIIDRVMNSMPQSDAGYLKEARNLALYHHEKWDGTGYPTGLSGEEIPLSARIMAVADVFDALISERSYKKAFSFEKAIEIIKESSGTHFDPNIVKAFLNAKDEVRKIVNK